MALTKEVRDKAEEMYLELAGASFRVVLIPAPEIKHSGHRVRICEESNPKWYQELCQSYTSIRGRGKKRYKRPRTVIDKRRILSALDSISRGFINLNFLNHQRIFELIKRELANSKPKEPGIFSNIFELRAETRRRRAAGENQHFIKNEVIGTKPKYDPLDFAF